MHEALSRSHPELNRIALCRDESGWTKWPWARELGNTRVVQGGLLDADRWGVEVGDKLDGIFHCAALVQHSRRDVEPVYRTNVQGTQEMIRLAAKHQCRVVYISTSGTVGCFKTPDESVDESADFCGEPVTTWPYYDSKIQSEQAARQLADELGVELVIIRPPVMLGPGDHRFRSTGNIIRHLRGKLPFLLRGGIHFIDVRDAAEALATAMFHSQPQPVYHLEGTACTVVQFFEMVEQASGVPTPRLRLSPDLALRVAQVTDWFTHLVPGDLHSPLPDPVVFEMAARYWGLHSSWAAQDLNWTPRSGQTTIDETVSWLREVHPKCATS